MIRIDNLKDFIILFIALAFFSCKNEKTDTEQGVDYEEKEALEKINSKINNVKKEEDKTIKQIDSSFWCNISHLNKLQKELGNGVTDETIEDFLLTFHQKCSVNAEYSEYSNELLFEVLNSKPKTVIKIISNNEAINISSISNELESPVNDLIDLKELSTRIVALDTDDKIKKIIIQSLKIALDKYN